VGPPGGSDDRPTVDLGPRAFEEFADGGDGAEEDGADGDGESEGEGDNATRTVAPDSVHSQATQQLGTRKRSPTDSVGAMASRYSTATSPAEAMRQDEIARTQIFLKVALAVGLAGGASAFGAHGDPIAFRAIMIGVVLTTVGSVLMLRLTRDPTRYETSRLIGPALLIAVGAYGGVYFWGCASPVAAMIGYGIYFFSLGANATITTAMYIVVALFHGLLALGIITGVIADRGIIHMDQLPTIDQIGVLGVIEALYFVTFYTARLSQRVTLDQVSKLEQAVRGVAQREALLAEARAELDRALKIGGPGRYTEQVVGSFKLGVLIGRGGMGEVYEARGVADEREAAVKLLHAGTLGDPNHVARFMREAQTAAKLDCPYVVRVLEVGTTTGEVPFLAMERLRGHDLAHMLRRQRKLTFEQARLLVEHVAGGLEAARSAGIVHRDLKPHNVFLSELEDTRTWKILDFGVSKSGGTGTLTKGHVIGTPAYMAPEQAKGEDVDHRADVYSLAAILYRAVTGHPAFTGKDVPTTLYDVVYRVPTQPSILAPVSADVDRVLALGLAKHTADRFATARELASWFLSAIDDKLSPEQRRRADDLMGRQPWGTRVT